MLKNYFRRFKLKWNIQSNWQLFRVMMVFAMAGQSILFSMPYVKDYFGVPNTINVLWRILFFIFVSIPIYQVFLLFWSLLFGEIRFFIIFIKNTFQKTIKLIKISIRK